MMVMLQLLLRVSAVPAYALAQARPTILQGLLVHGTHTGERMSPLTK